MSLLTWLAAWLNAPRCMRCNARLDKYSEPSLRFPEIEVECMACGCVQPKPKELR